MPQVAKASRSYSADIQIHAGDVTLEGNLSLPSECNGVVLFAHGSGSSRHSPRNQFVASTLLEAGNGTLLFDLLTPEEEAVDLQTRHLRFDIELLSTRLIDATYWLKSRFPNLTTGYFGSSTGGAAALIAAAESANSIRAVVSRGGRPDLAGDALGRVKSPTLLVVGELDYRVIEMNRKAYERLTCEKELRIIPGATHLFEEPGTLAQVAHLAADWFRQHLH